MPRAAEESISPSTTWAPGRENDGEWWWWYWGATASWWKCSLGWLFQGWSSMLLLSLDLGVVTGPGPTYARYEWFTAAAWCPWNSLWSRKQRRMRYAIINGLLDKMKWSCGEQSINWHLTYMWWLQVPVPWNTQQKHRNNKEKYIWGDDAASQIKLSGCLRTNGFNFYGREFSYISKERHNSTIMVKVLTRKNLVERVHQMGTNGPDIAANTEFF